MADGGEVVAEVDLGVDLATVVAVRARLREIGEDLGVARLEEDAVPERPRLRLGRQRALGLLGLLATVAVDGEKGLEELVARDHPAALGQELGKLALQEVVLHVDHVAPEAPALDLDGDVARGGVARLVLGNGGDGRSHLVVPGEGDDGDVEIGVGRPRGIRAERQGTDAHRHSGGASRAHDDEPAAALGPVARGRDDLDGGRREVEGDGYGGHGLVVHANGPPEAVAGAHLEHGAAFAQAQGAAVDHELDALRTRLRAGEGLLGEDHARGALLEADLHRADAAAHRMEIHGEGRLDPDPARDGLEDRADARNGLPPREVSEDGDDEEGGNDDDAEPEPDGGASHAARIARSSRRAARNVL